VTDVKADIVNEALRIVAGARREAYGKPEDNFRRIADLWTTHMLNTGRAVVFEPRDVASLMILLKMARLAENPGHRDSIVDIVGYALCYAESVLPTPGVSDDDDGA
jgi:hypothetical protein